MYIKYFLAVFVILSFSCTKNSNTRQSITGIWKPSSQVQWETSAISTSDNFKDTIFQSGITSDFRSDGKIYTSSIPFGIPTYDTTTYSINGNSIILSNPHDSSSHMTYQIETLNSNTLSLHYSFMGGLGKQDLWLNYKRN